MCAEACTGLHPVKHLWTGAQSDMSPCLPVGVILPALTCIAPLHAAGTKTTVSQAGQLFTGLAADSFAACVQICTQAGAASGNTNCMWATVSDRLCSRDLPDGTPHWPAGQHTTMGVCHAMPCHAMAWHAMPCHARYMCTTLQCYSGEGTPQQWHCCKRLEPGLHHQLQQQCQYMRHVFSLRSCRCTFCVCMLAV
jgi:hypothetical protein